MTFSIFLLSWGPVFSWAGLIFYLSSIPSLDSGLGVWDLILRKSAHIVEFAVLSGLLLRAMKRTWSSLTRPPLLLWTGSLSFLYAVSDEIHQSFVPGRGPSVWDVLVDAVGVGLMLWVFCWSSFRRKPESRLSTSGKELGPGFRRGDEYVVLLFVLSIVLFSACGPDSQLKRANKLEKKGKYYLAWQKYQEFAADHPKHAGAPEAMFRAGWLAQKQIKDCSMAGIFYDSVLEKYPQSDPWARLAANQKNNCPDYFPLLPGALWVEGDSESKGKNARIETVCKPAPEKGSMPSESGLLVRTYFAGASKFKSIDSTYKKTATEVQEFTSEYELRPKIILMLPVRAGTRWKTRSADRLFSYEIAAVDVTVKVEAGEFPGCVLVKSTAEGSTSATLDYYAPGVGRVLNGFSTPQGEKRNIELMSFKPGPDVDFNRAEAAP